MVYKAEYHFRRPGDKKRILSARSYTSHWVSYRPRDQGTERTARVTCHNSSKSGRPGTRLQGSCIQGSCTSLQRASNDTSDEHR